MTTCDCTSEESRSSIFDEQTKNLADLWDRRGSFNTPNEFLNEYKNTFFIALTWMRFEWDPKGRVKLRMHKHSPEYERFHSYVSMLAVHKKRWTDCATKYIHQKYVNHNPEEIKMRLSQYKQRMFRLKLSSCQNKDVHCLCNYYDLFSQAQKFTWDSKAPRERNRGRYAKLSDTQKVANKMNRNYAQENLARSARRAKKLANVDYEGLIP